MTTVIKPCHCTNSFQDALYGPGKRLFNLRLAKTGTPPSARCTVCGDVRETRGAVIRMDDAD